MSSHTGKEENNNKEKEKFIIAITHALSGESDSQWIVGYYYDTGYGVEIDYKQAFIWYTKSIENGSNLAYNNLGILYKGGYGIEKNKDKAKECFLKSKDYKYSYYNLGHLFSEEKNIEKSIEYFMKATLYGNKQCADYIEKLLLEYINDNKKLKEELDIERKYKPGGEGFKECEKEFDDLKSK